ncbi:sodium-independent sulfate anion transporter-like isoform X2 [Ischnura elegans]|uniref:sodium-independent sulfate anion transporter-like isoform X2 n=1 Tax=Ischnura elegans TaxID=197161 RepID=UPI001ED8ACB6|nr:sodium-independent sulfate anion transporter-like isoform X2 [Ischnura elegans]
MENAGGKENLPGAEETKPGGDVMVTIPGFDSQGNPEGVTGNEQPQQRPVEQKDAVTSNKKTDDGGKLPEKVEPSAPGSKADPKKGMRGDDYLDGGSCRILPEGGLALAVTRRTRSDGPEGPEGRAGAGGSSSSHRCCPSIPRPSCSRQSWERRFPVLAWGRTYTGEHLLADFMAGLTVGLTAIPQGIAYGVVAGLPPQYGLYSAFMGCFMYILLGSCKDITIGPTAIMALMAQVYVESYGPSFAVLLTFLSGVIILALGLLQLGFLVDFISMPVTAGFTSAAAITIASGQVKGILGIPGKSNEFLEAWENIFEHIGQTNLWDLFLGVTCIVLLLAARKLKDVKSSNRVVAAVIRLTSLGRNAIIVIIGTLVAYICSLNGATPFQLTGAVQEGLPNFEPPPFSATVGNKTYTFIEMASELGSSIAVIPLVAILESIAIGKAFSNGKALDATQEMVALGACNILGSFVHSIPVTGSFTRTAVNNASGVKTPLGGLFTGVMVLMALGFLTSTFYFIPKATLSAVIICAVIFMIEYHMVIVLWKTKKLDLIPCFTTFFVSLLLGLEYGILVGVAVNLLFLLYDVARPSIKISKLKYGHNCVLLMTPDRSVVFPSAEYVREYVLKSSGDDDPEDCNYTVVIDGTHIQYIDATAAKCIKLMIEDIEAKKYAVILWNWKRSVAETCFGIDPGMLEYFHCEESLEKLFAGMGLPKIADFYSCNQPHATTTPLLRSDIPSYQSIA